MRLVRRVPMSTQFGNTGALYRQLGDDHFVRFDPSSGEYSVVGADDVPELENAGSAPLVSGLDGARADEQRRNELLLSAMLAAQVEAHENGTSAGGILHLIADSLRDPESLAHLQRIFDAQQHGFEF